MAKCSLMCLALAVLVCACGAPVADEPTATPTTEAGPPDTVAPAGGAQPALLADLHWLGHASFRLDGPSTVYFDPWRLAGEPVPADVILISHEHQDHFDPASLARIATPETVIVTNATVAARLEGGDVQGEVRVVAPGDQIDARGVTIEAVPAYNIGKTNHPKEAGGLGFVVTRGGERLYFAGDTSRIPEMASIACDVALLPIDGTYTMDVEEAAQAAADIGPRVAVPMHNRNVDPEAFRAACDCPVVIAGE